jgi:4-amino-4-deoxy-L-arabinose transferase-like glycosyltransferase
MRFSIPSLHRTVKVGSKRADGQTFPAPVAGALFDWWDLLTLGTLTLLWLCFLVLRNSSLPLQIWDESRLANSALEMVRSGHWLIPSPGGVPDHWSVKPPLLIWQMAALMRVGLPPLVAVRLPTWLAALAIVGTIWAVCRYALHDRVAGALAGLLMFSSNWFTCVHFARTGDYDVPVALFTLLYVLAFWRSIEEDNRVLISWFAIFAVAIVFAVMTKGVVGAFGLVGVFVFSLIKGRIVTLLRNLHVWVLTVLVLVVCIGYYVSREQYDPGYLQAVWQNELGPRFSSTIEEHAGGPLFYIASLIGGFTPATMLLPLAALTILRRDSRRSSLATLCVVCSATNLLVLTAAQTKIVWYLAPVFPFLAIATAVGITDGLRWVKARELRLPKPLRARPLGIALGVALTVATARSFYLNQILPVRWARSPDNGQLWYGALFDELRARGNSEVIVLDGGYRDAPHYDPMLQFYADVARTNGLRLKLPALDARPLGPRSVDDPQAPPSDKLVATCDPNLIPWLEYREGFSLHGQVHSCIFGIVRPR